MDDALNAIEAFLEWQQDQYVATGVRPSLDDYRECLRVEALEETIDSVWRVVVRWETNGLTADEAMREINSILNSEGTA